MVGAQVRGGFGCRSAVMMRDRRRRKISAVPAAATDPRDGIPIFRRKWCSRPKARIEAPDRNKGRSAKCHIGSLHSSAGHDAARAKPQRLHGLVDRERIVARVMQQDPPAHKANAWISKDLADALKEIGRRIT